MAKPRVIITTDIGGDDKDDAQSFIHALLYADEVNYRGFVSTMTDDRNGNPDYHFNRIIDAYGRDLSKLRETGDYPSASEMRSLIHKGSVNPDFPGALSSGARHIIDEARAASPNDPVYLLAWGPVHDIAAALKAAPDIVDSVRVYSIYGLGQDRVNPEAYQWMKDAVGNDGRYSDLFWINAEESFRGMYAGSSGQNDPGRNLNWVKDNVDGHGALGNLFHDVYSYDLYGNGGSAKGLKMGDTPSLLYVLDNIDNDNPGARSWGGSFAKNGWGDNTWDDRDGSGDRLGSYDGARTVYENRSEAWGDFADRLDRAKDGSGRKDNDSVDLGESPTGGVPNGSEEVMVTTGRTQAEAFDLAGGYVYEGRSASAGGANIKVQGSGTAEATFDGASGRYDIDVGWLNETDGEASFALRVDGRTVKSWDGSGGNNGEEIASVTVDLDRGDTIELVGRSDHGEYARFDWINIAKADGSSAPSEPDDAPAAPVEPEPTEPSPPSAPSGAAIGAERMQAEAFDLAGGYVYEGRSASAGGANIKVQGSGTAEATFDGASGRYDIDVGWLNETDGEASFALRVDGRTVKSWDGSGGNNGEEIASVTVDLDRGDTIELVGRSDHGEYARFDWINIAKADGSSAPSEPDDAPAAPVEPEPTEPSPPSAPSGAAIGAERMQAEAFDLAGGYVYEGRSASAGGANIKVQGSGTAEATFDGASGRYDIDVGWLNETDGEASFALRVDGRTVKSWDGSGGNNGEEIASVTVDLDRGDTIELVGRSDHGEYARFDWINIAKAGSTAPDVPSTPSEPSTPSTPDSVDADLVVFAGQSNGAGHFYRRGGDSTGGSLGNDVFERALDAATGDDATALNVAVSGSGSNQYADSSDYWWDVDRDRPGPELERAMSMIRSAESSGRDVDAFIWAQGEDDARSVNDSRSNLSQAVNRFDEATRAVFDYVRDELDDPDLPIFIQELGDFPEDGGWLDGPSGALDAMRNAQARIVNSMDDVYLGARTTDLDDHYDTIHFNNEGYGIIAERLADNVADVLV